MGLSCLVDITIPVVLDASAAINLNASGFAEPILRALPNRTVVTEIVMNELTGDSRTGRRDAELIAALKKAGLVVIAQLSEMQLRHFETLVVGSATETLDDGEAATIAYAAESDAVAILDDRKAIRISATRYPQVSIGSTVDLFSHPSVIGTLGKASLADAVFAALQQARMRVLPRHIDWVVALIGQERARMCPSLPEAARK
jgi:predicted nucleic acid-binding protein